MATTHELAACKTDLVPDPVEYAALLPGVETPRLLFVLHGGGGDRAHLELMRPTIEKAWADGLLPPCVVITPSVTRSFYMNYRDGSEAWEDVVLGPIVETAVERYGVSGLRADTVGTGISMGGMGILRMAFKHPDRFAGIAAMEPGIEPALRWADIEMEDRFWRDDALMARIYGDTANGGAIDHEYWAANNPASILAADPSRLRGSGLAIYLEVGDQDSFGLHRGTEFLHRLLFDHGVSHEYRLVRGADHTGRTIPARLRDALAFLGKALDPPPADDTLGRLHGLIDLWRSKAQLPGGPPRLS